MLGVDFDGAPLPQEQPIPFDIINESSEDRYHGYYLIQRTTDLVKWSETQAQLAAYYGGDAKVFDPPRVFRLPGFYHQKTVKHFRTKVIRKPTCEAAQFNRHMLQEIIDAHPCEFKKPSARVEPPMIGNIEWDTDRNVEAAAHILSKARLPGEGNRNNFAYRLACQLNDRAISPERSEELLSAWNDEQDDPLPQDEIARVINSALRYKNSPAGSKAAIDPVDDFADQPIDPDEIIISGDKPVHVPASRLKFKPTPYTYRDPASISMRQWIYKPHYLRRVLTLTAAQGGVGKSSLVMAESVAMAGGLQMLRYEPTGEALNVWYWNGEDDEDELDRRFGAILKYYKLEPDDFDGQLFRDYGQKLPIKIAEMSEGVPKIAKPVVKHMVEAIRDYKIDVLNLDPFVTTHNVTENDTVAMELVARQWAYIAQQTNSSIGISHHTRKTGGVAATIEDSRGSSALIAVARVRRAINKMSAGEAEKANIPEERRSFYFSVNLDYTNVAKPVGGLEWYHMESVDLENNPLQFLEGDEIGVPVAYGYNALEVMPVDDIQYAAVVGAIRAKGKGRADPQSSDYIGLVVAKALGLSDIAQVKGVKASAQVKADRRTVSALISKWVTDGVLEVYSDWDPQQRRDKPFIRLSTNASPRQPR